MTEPRARLRLGQPCRRSQAAMEYLMTYGWAILIITIVLGALFQLGVFSGVNSPRAQPGMCRVIRPLGPGTSAYISLQGMCTGLLPQFVAQFNGQNSYVRIKNTPLLNPTNAFTISAWVSFTGINTQSSPTGWVGTIMDKGPEAAVPHFWFGYGSGSGCSQWYVEISNSSTQGGAGYCDSSIATDTWYHMVETFNSGAVKIYKNGNLAYSSTVATNSIGQGTYDLSIGSYNTGSSYVFNGLMSNVQFYNTSLTANHVLALYKEGIGGAPIQVTNLIGWWALNGNANDTSGNFHTGIPSNVRYSSFWTGSYPLR